MNRRDLLKLLGMGITALTVFPKLTYTHEVSKYNVFKGYVDNRWSNPKNWSWGRLPLPTDDVSIMADCSIDLPKVCVSGFRVDAPVCVDFSNVELTLEGNCSLSKGQLRLDNDGFIEPSICYIDIRDKRTEKVPTYLESLRRWQGAQW